MSLLAPGLLAALAALVPLVALHLRRRRQEVEVPSVLLWRESAGAPAARRWAPPLPVLLLLQALVVVLLAVALARPVWGGGGERVTSVAVVEAGVRMQAPGRLEAAVRAARGADVVVVADGRARVVDGVDAVRATRARADLARALELAAAALDGPGEVRLVRAADTPVPEVDARGVRLVDVPVGAAVDRSVERVAARCAPADPAACVVEATVRNGSQAARSERVAVAVDGRAVGTRTLAVPAGGSADLALDAPAGALVRVALVGARDGLPGDDAATVAVPRRAVTRVALVTDRPATAPLARALAAVPGVTVRRVAPGARPGAADLVVLDRRPLAEAPGGMPVLAVAPPGGRALRDATPVGAEQDDPLLDGVALAGLTIDAASVPALPATLIPVVRAAGGPLLAAGESAGRRVAVLTFDPARSSLPSLVAFPTLIGNVVGWARDDAAETSTSTVGTPVLLAAPARVDRPDAERWRWFVVAALLVLVAEALVARRGLAVRGAVAAVLLAALAVGGGDRPDVVVLDVSASVADGSGRDEVRDCTAPCRVVRTGTATATDLAAGLRAAAARVPDGGRVTLLSDGAATTGDAAAEARALRARDVAVATVRLPARRRAGDLALTRLDAPDTVRTGTTFSLQLTLDAPARGPVTLTLTRDGEPAGTRRVTARAGATPLALDVPAPAPGLHRYRVTAARAGDPQPANDALDAVVRVAEGPRVSILGDAGRLPAQLRAAGAQVSTGTLDPAADAVVLADVPPPDAATTAALRTAVRERGTGLLVLGGERSLSLGRYAGTGLDALLPTRSLTPRAARRRALALELVVDRSSSMAGLAGGGTRTKLELTQAAARSALAAVARDEGEFGLVAFDAAARELVPLARLTSTADADAAGRRIDALDVGGGTSIAAGLEAGIDRLAASRAPRRHLVLVSDGVSERGDYDALIAAAQRARVTISTVALGAEADRALLRRLARATGGRMTDVPNAQRLPRVLAGEARRVTPGVAAQGTLPVTAGAASPILGALDGEAPPAVRGLVATGLRAGATAPLLARVDGRTLPVLAQGQAGLGRTAVWTPGAGAWAGAWARTGVLPAAVAWVARGPEPEPTAPRLRGGDTLVVDPLAAGGDPLTLASVSGTAGDTSVAFAEAAPSRYVARLPAAEGPGARVVSVQTNLGPAGAVAVPYARELAPPGVTPDRLATLGPPADQRHAWWPWLTGAALALLLAVAATDRRARAPRRGRPAR